MKKILTTILLGFIAIANAQVIIGDNVGTVPLTPETVPGTPNKTSVLLEFAAGQYKGLILPYVRVKPSGAAVTPGTIVLDASAPLLARVKYYNANTTPGTDGWVDLSGQDADVTAALSTQPTMVDVTEAAGAKSIIGNPASTADGVLVSESPLTTSLPIQKIPMAMVLPTVADVQLIPSPSPGMIVYVNKTGAKRLAVYNGSKWSFWKP